MASDDAELEALREQYGQRWDFRREAGRLFARSRSEEGRVLDAPSEGVMIMHIAAAEFPELPRAGGGSGG